MTPIIRPNPSRPAGFSSTICRRCRVCPAWIYANRNLVERCWNRLKEWRAVATRYEKTAHAFIGVLCIAATMDWLKA